MAPVLVALVFGLVALCGVVHACESPLVRGLFGELRRMWKAAGVPGRAVAVAVVLLCAQSGGSKGIAPVTQLFNLLFWHPSSVWQLAAPVGDVAGAKAANATAVEQAGQSVAVIESNDVVTISFDWHATDRLPYHESQNVMGWQAWVTATNVNGTLCDDHYVAFNATASTNPAVILIEYACRLDDGTVERYSMPVLTNSYPMTVPVILQSGTNMCYWFRCARPPAFTNSVCDWNGEVLFGAPEGSGKGFDLLGTLIVDDGNQVWIGATTNVVIGGVTNVIRNGVNITGAL